MTHELTVRMILELTDMGSLRLEKIKPGRKAVWKWEMGSKTEVYMFLNILHSYFLTKAEHATVALEYVKRRLLEIPFKKEDTELLNKLKKLNKRGG